MPAFVDTGLNLAHVDDVAAGHLAALERGRIGERYILGGDNVLLADMLADIAAPGRAAAAYGQAAADLLYPIAYGAEVLASLRGVEPFITMDGLRMARHHMFFDDSKARRELGYVSRPYREGLADAIAWFRATAISNDRRRRLPHSARIWAYLLFGRGWFWLCGERDDSPPQRLRTRPDAWPSVVAIIPARDEADMIAHSVGSLCGRIILGRFPWSWSTIRARTAPPPPRAPRRGGPRSRSARNRHRNRPAAGLDRQTVRRCARAWPRSKRSAARA